MLIFIKAFIALLFLSGKSFLSTRLYRYLLVIPFVVVFGIIDFSRRLPKEVVDKKGKKEKLPLDPLTILLLRLPDPSLRAPYECLGPDAKMTTLWYFVLGVVGVQYISNTAMSIIFILQELIFSFFFSASIATATATTTTTKMVIFSLLSFVGNAFLLFGESIFFKKEESHLSMIGILSIALLSGPAALFSNFIVNFLFVKEKHTMLRPIISVLLVTLFSIQQQQQPSLSSSS